MHKRIAFTLAEVLITLGILGVVAVLTLPSLISRYREKVLETRYNRAKAVITNAAQMRLIKYNLEKYEDYADIMHDESFFAPCFKLLEENYEVAEKCAMEKVSEIYTWGFNNVVSFPAKNMNSVEYNVGAAYFRLWNGLEYTFTTADGISYGVYNPDGSTMLVDTNSSKLPNELKKDMFLFKISSNLKVIDITDVLFSSCSIENLDACNTRMCSLLIEKTDKNGKGYASLKDGGCYHIMPVTDLSTNCLANYYPPGSTECQNLK